MKRHAAVSFFALALMAARAFGASVDGVQLHWTATGGDRQAVVFVHGWTCDDRSWDRQVSDLAADYNVITLDLPGHGRSGPVAGDRFSMDLFARAVEAVRMEAGVDQIVLVGHSMGTPVIRRYALSFPEHVKALVLVDGLVQIAGGASDFAPPPMTGTEGLAARENMIDGMFSDATTPELRQRIRSMMLGSPEATAAGAMTATWDTSQWSNDPIAVPVLALYADGSALANREGMAQLYTQLEYHEIQGTGHFLMMEKPDEFNRLLRAFLGRVR
jgi:pimeloyl-ACP methyl ester carboxylesterase